MIEISNKTFSEMESKRSEAFRTELCAYLAEAFEDIETNERERRLDGLLDQCSKLGITSEYGVTCYCFLSFLAGKPMIFDDTYVTAHHRYVAEFSDVNQLPIDLYEVIEPGLS